MTINAELIEAERRLYEARHRLRKRQRARARRAREAEAAGQSRPVTDLFAAEVDRATAIALREEEERLIRAREQQDGPRPESSISEEEVSRRQHPELRRRQLERVRELREALGIQDTEAQETTGDAATEEQVNHEQGVTMDSWNYRVAKEARTKGYTLIPQRDLPLGWARYLQSGDRVWLVKEKRVAVVGGPIINGRISLRGWPTPWYVRDNGEGLEGEWLLRPIDLDTSQIFDETVKTRLGEITGMLTIDTECAVSPQLVENLIDRQEALQRTLDYVYQTYPELKPLQVSHPRTEERVIDP